MKNIHLDLVRVTEAGAVAAGAYVGRGDKEGADKAATDAMRMRLNRIDFAGRVVIGEGKKDKSFGLYDGEIVGQLGLLHSESQEIKDKDIQLVKPQYWDIATDPIEGTTPTAKGGYEAMSVIALAPEGKFLSTECFYMKKIAYGPEVARRVKIKVTDDVLSTMRIVALALDKPIDKVTACILDRPRHESIVCELRKIGCRIKFIQDCDVTACIATCLPESGIDVYLGTGGSPEGVIAAAAVKCMGGFMQGMLVETDGTIADDKIYELEDLAGGDVLFAATGITDGLLLKGVRFTSRGPVTHSIAMRSESGTIRKIETTHGN